MTSRQKQILRIVRQFHPNETLEKQLLVVFYEVGQLAKCVQRIIVDPEHEVGYKAEAAIAVADLITQLRLTCELIGHDFDKLDEIGFQRLYDRTTELAKEFGR